MTDVFMELSDVLVVEKTYKHWNELNIFLVVLNVMVLNLLDEAEGRTRYVEYVYCQFAINDFSGYTQYLLFI